MTDQQMTDTFIAQNEAHLAEVNKAAKELRAELKQLKRLAKGNNQLNFDAVQQLMYSVGSAARWFLHPVAPNLTPSPSLTEDRTGRHRADGEETQEGVI